jgi:hypothetical protein
MAAYPSLTVSDLSEFSGREESSYTLTSYVTQAVLQAKVLFAWATSRTDRDSDWPDDADQAELALLGLTALADAIYLNQAYSRAMVTPFQSETIGSYSYTVSAKRVMSLLVTGEPTGVDLFDLAVSQLSLSSDLTTDSLQVMTNELHGARQDDGTFKIFGPGDIDAVDTFGFVNSVPTSYDPNS